MANAWIYGALEKEPLLKEGGFLIPFTLIIEKGQPAAAYHCIPLDRRDPINSLTIRKLYERNNNGTSSLGKHLGVRDERTEFIDAHSPSEIHRLATCFVERVTPTSLNADSTTQLVVEFLTPRQTLNLILRGESDNVPLHLIASSQELEAIVAKSGGGGSGKSNGEGGGGRTKAMPPMRNGILQPFPIPLLSHTSHSDDQSSSSSPSVSPSRSEGRGEKDANVNNQTRATPIEHNNSNDTTNNGDSVGRSSSSRLPQNNNKSSNRGGVGNVSLPANYVPPGGGKLAPFKKGGHAIAVLFWWRADRPTTTVFPDPSSYEAGAARWGYIAKRNVNDVNDYKLYPFQRGVTIDADGNHGLSERITLSAEEEQRIYRATEFLISKLSVKAGGRPIVEAKFVFRFAPSSTSSPSGEGGGGTRPHPQNSDSAPSSPSASPSSSTSSSSSPQPETDLLFYHAPLLRRVTDELEGKVRFLIPRQFQQGTSFAARNKGNHVGEEDLLSTPRLDVSYSTGPMRRSSPNSHLFSSESNPPVPVRMRFLDERGMTAVQRQQEKKALALAAKAVPKLSPCPDAPREHPETDPLKRAQIKHHSDAAYARSLMDALDGKKTIPLQSLASRLKLSKKELKYLEAVKRDASVVDAKDVLEMRAFSLEYQKEKGGAKGAATTSTSTSRAISQSDAHRKTKGSANNNTSMPTASSSSSSHPPLPPAKQALNASYSYYDTPAYSQRKAGRFAIDTSSNNAPHLLVSMGLAERPKRRGRGRKGGDDHDDGDDAADGRKVKKRSAKASERGEEGEGGGDMTSGEETTTQQQQQPARHRLLRRSPTPSSTPAGVNAPLSSSSTSLPLPQRKYRHQRKSEDRQRKRNAANGGNMHQSGGDGEGEKDSASYSSSASSDRDDTGSESDTAADRHVAFASPPPPSSPYNVGGDEGGGGGADRKTIDDVSRIETVDEQRSLLSPSSPQKDDANKNNSVCAEEALNVTPPQIEALIENFAAASYAAMAKRDARGGRRRSLSPTTTPTARYHHRDSRTTTTTFDNSSLAAYTTNASNSVGGDGPAPREYLMSLFDTLLSAHAIYFNADNQRGAAGNANGDGGVRSGGDTDDNNAEQVAAYWEAVLLHSQLKKKAPNGQQLQRQKAPSHQKLSNATTTTTNDTTNTSSGGQHHDHQHLLRLTAMRAAVMKCLDVLETLVYSCASRALTLPVSAIHSAARRKGKEGEFPSLPPCEEKNDADGKDQNKEKEEPSSGTTSHQPRLAAGNATAAVRNSKANTHTTANDSDTLLSSLYASHPLFQPHHLRAIVTAYKGVEQLCVFTLPLPSVAETSAPSLSSSSSCVSAESILFPLLATFVDSLSIVGRTVMWCEAKDAAAAGGEGVDGECAGPHHSQQQRRQSNKRQSVAGGEVVVVLPWAMTVRRCLQRHRLPPFVDAQQYCDAINKVMERKMVKGDAGKATDVVNTSASSVSALSPSALGLSPSQPSTAAAIVIADAFECVESLVFRPPAAMRPAVSPAAATAAAAAEERSGSVISVGRSNDTANSIDTSRAIAARAFVDAVFRTALHPPHSCDTDARDDDSGAKDDDVKDDGGERPTNAQECHQTRHHQHHEQQNANMEERRGAVKKERNDVGEDEARIRLFPLPHSPSVLSALVSKATAGGGGGGNSKSDIIASLVLSLYSSSSSPPPHSAPSATTPPSTAINVAPLFLLSNDTFSPAALDFQVNTFLTRHLPCYVLKVLWLADHHPH